MVGAGYLLYGVMVTLLHVLTTPSPSTLMTLPSVETPRSGENSLVTTAGDVTVQFKHVPAFGILIRKKVKNLTFSQAAKTAQTRSLD